MRHFQALLLAVLAVISVELGILISKLPTPAAQATQYAPPGNYPTVQNPQPVNPSSLVDQFATLNGKEDKIIQNQSAIYSAIVRASQTGNNVLSRVNDDSKRLLMTCYMSAQVFGSQALAGPSAAGAPRNRLDLCRSGWWKAEAFNNFNIPWGP